MTHAVSGTQGMIFSLAVDRAWTDEYGLRQEDTDWFAFLIMFSFYFLLQEQSIPIIQKHKATQENHQFENK